MQSSRAAVAPPSKGNAVAFPAGACRSAPWRDILISNDFTRLWGELRRLVKSHPLARASRRGLLFEEGKKGRSAHNDLTQELFVRLFGKGRFQHYLDTEMRDADIEREIAWIEVSNLFKDELRKRRPESYRLARRVAVILQSSAQFRRFDKDPDACPSRRLANRVYGLRGWPDDKAKRQIYELEQIVRLIPVRPRDRRIIGRSGDAQLVIDNADLEELITHVFESCDAPLDMLTLRTFVLSRVPLMDTYLLPLEKSGGPHEGGKQFEPADGRENPEQRLLRQELERGVADRVVHFLHGLRSAVRGKDRQYRRILGVLWHCYLSPDHVSQLEAAARLGVSDTLVSDYRCRIVRQLRALPFSQIEQARLFEILLRERVRALVLESPTTHRSSP